MGYSVWGTPTCVRTYAYIIWPVYRIYYVNMPIRVGVHICVGAGRKGVGQQTQLLKSFIPTKYIQISHYLKNGPHKGGLFPFYPFWKKNIKRQPSFLKNLFGYGKYIKKSVFVTRGNTCYVLFNSIYIISQTTNSFSLCFSIKILI